MRKLRREPALLLALIISLGLIAAFIIYPQVQVIITPGLGGYVNFLAAGMWSRPLLNSVVSTALATATAVLLGLVYAYAQVMSDMRGKPFFQLIGILPLLSPPFVVAASYLLLFGPRGIVSYGLLGQSWDVFGVYGLWGVQTIAFFPFAYQLIADVLSRRDPRQEQAARNLGAGPWQVFRSVTLPMARPGLVSATLITAIYILEDFGNPALIAGRYNVLPTQAYGLVSGYGDISGAAAVSTILTALALALYVAHLRLEGRGRSYVTVSGRASSMPYPPVPRYVSWACFAACSLLAIVILLVYGVLVVSALTVSFPNNMAGTLAHFAYIGSHAVALRNTLVYGGAAAVACTLYSLLLAFLVQRHEWPGRRVVDFLAIMPAAVPGIFFGLGYVTAFNQRWLDWLDRGTLITISMVFWNIPVAYRAGLGGLQQISRTIDEAGTSLGASSLRTLRDILFPLLHGALLTGAVTTFVRAVTTLSVVIFLFTPATTVATITIFQLVNDFEWGGACAFTVTVIGLTMLVLVAVWAASGHRVRVAGALRNG